MTTITRQVPIPPDEEGFIDRCCPATDCLRPFKVLETSLQAANAVAMYCPFCRHEDDLENFVTVEQREYLERERDRFAAEIMNELLSGFTKGMSRRQHRKSPISITWTTQLANVPASIPADVLKPMALRIECDTCGCIYAVIGSGFFCPLCGANSVRHTFRQSVEKSRTAIRIARELHETMADPDVAAVGRRALLESQFVDLVSAFQRFANALYPLLSSNPSLGRDHNLFQRLDDGSKAWAKAGGRPFETILTANELSDLRRYFQQRHKFAHNEGIVDQNYIDRSGDMSYRIGQRLSITEVQVAQMADLVEKLGLSLEADVVREEPTTSPSASQMRTEVLPRRLPGLSESDWMVFQRICDIAVEVDHESFDGQSVWQLLPEGMLTQEQFAESLEMLESKSLVQASRTLDRNPIPRNLTIKQRGVTLYYSQSMPDYESTMRRVASEVVGGASTSNVIADHTGLPLLFVHHALREFESRDWIGRVFWNAGIGVVPSHRAPLKRFAEHDASS